MSECQIEMLAIVIFLLFGIALGYFIYYNAFKNHP